MNVFKTSVPCYLQIGKKNVINLNTYRNIHYHVNNKAKVMFKNMVIDSFKECPRYTEPIHITFEYWFRNKRLSDLPNIHAVLDKYMLDLIVSVGVIEDDNIKNYVSFYGKYMGVDKEKNG